MFEPKKNPDRIRALLFVAITFALTWLYCLLVLYPVLDGSNLSGVPVIINQVLAAVVMFFPAIGVVLTRLITKEGFGDNCLKPNLKGNWKHYLLAWFGPGLLTLVGAGLYFLIFPDKFDSGFGYLTATMETSGASAADLPLPMGVLILLTAVQGMVLAPALNAILCFGEEWGWRGYLLPKMSKELPTLPTLLISGIIWGLWHAPLTIVGHNYGVGYPGFPFAGIAMMCLFCTALGIFLSYVTLKTKSCIPAIIGHGAVNGIAGFGLLLTATGGDAFVGPAPMGIIGMIPFLIVAVVLLFKLKK